MTMPKTVACKSESLLAFEVEINSMTCVVFASTPAKARWIAVKSYWEAGYGRGSGTWPRAKAKRVPHLDKSPLRDREQKAWCPDYAGLQGEPPKQEIC
jgi:hypothetical protein